MYSTSASLLDRLRSPDEQTAWVRFVDLYSPLIYHWAIKLGVAQQDAADFVQEVFSVLVRELPKFRHDPAQRFRAWMWTVARNKQREKIRKQSAQPAAIGDAPVDEIPAESDDGLDEHEYRNYLVQRAQQIMRNDFEKATWSAFWETTVRDRSAREVAQELNIAVETVHKYKSRVLRRLRQELAGLLD